eukprot:COSAG02_NODE_9848_length_2094_cov_2.142857_2_plen_70_part_00
MYFQRRKQKERTATLQAGLSALLLLEAVRPGLRLGSLAALTGLLGVAARLYIRDATELQGWTGCGRGTG